MTWIRRYKQKKKLTFKISVDFNFKFTSHAWLCALALLHRLLYTIKSRWQDFMQKMALISQWGTRITGQNIMSRAVFPLRFLSLGQFYQIWQNWRVSCAKSLALAENCQEKASFFTQSLKICWANFLKCWANFATYGLRGNIGVGVLFLAFRRKSQC